MDNRGENFDGTQQGLACVDLQTLGTYFKLRPDSLADGVLAELMDRSTNYMYEHQYGDEDKKLPADYWTISEPENAVFTKLVVAEAVEELTRLYM